MENFVTFDPYLCIMKETCIRVKFKQVVKVM